jgi:DNA polymerase
MTSTWHHVSVDIETYSSVDIKKAGLYKYAQSPDFDILLIAFAVDDGPINVIDLTVDPGAEGAGRNWQLLQDFRRLWVDIDSVFHAYNAAFEHYCLNTWAARHGWETHPIGDWKCTMAHGLYCGYTAGLAATGEAMGLPQDKRKLGIGGALIRKFCVPQKPNKAHPEPWRVRPTDEPEKWELFKEYCKQDVETERTIEKRLRKWPMPAREQLLWELTVEANIEGVGVDRDLVTSAIAVGETEQERMVAEAREISGLDNPKSVQQLMKWLNAELETDGETEIADLRKTTVAELLATGVDSAKAQRMLELRQLMSKTSTKKYDALAAAACRDGRVRGMMFYYGANRTGRWAGRIVQPQNLPQNHLNDLEFARERVKALDIEMIKVCWGSVPDTLSQLIRTAFIPRPGKLYAVADYSAIEARVVAWLAGETWVLDAFREGQDIYCATASQMFGVPVEKHGQNAHLRQRGKVATLALGYGGGESALVAMGALRMGIPEEDLPEIKLKWRQANPAICRLWRRVEDAAMKVMQTGEAQAVQIQVRDPERARENEALTGAEPGSYSDYFRRGAAITLRREGDPATGQDFLTIELPTRRKLFYAQPKLLPAKNFPERTSLHYMSVNQTSKKWALTDTWGGKLVENITQAVARDCLAETLLRLRRRRLTAVFHVHDEVIVEVDSADQLQDVLDIMAEPLDWAPGLPLKGAGFVCDYYQKD